MAVKEDHLALLNCLANRIKDKSYYPDIKQMEKDRFFYWVLNNIFLSVEYGQITTERNLDCITCIKQIPSPCKKILLTENRFKISSVYSSCISKKDFYSIMHAVAEEINCLSCFHVECITPIEDSAVQLAQMTISFQQ